MQSEFMHTVLVVQRRMTHYRVPFFEALRERLAMHGCRLKLAYGQPTDEELRKNDSADIDWGTRLETRYLLGGKICWQPFPRLLRGADLVVMTAENKLLYNLFVQFFEHRSRVALWGHGANLQGNPRSLRERFKRRVSRKADWWFAYTQLSVPLIERTLFPRDRITVLNNSVDTAELGAMHASVSETDLAGLRERLQLVGRHVGIFVGSLYAEKRIEFTLEAAAEIRRRLPDFEFLILGDGPQKGLVLDFCEANPWARYLGARHGTEKAQLLALSHVMLNPGLVGLGILDSFVCRVPLLTTDCRIHSPEIAYLVDGENGVMTENNLDDYVESVVATLSDPAAAEALRRGCDTAAREYTVDRMAERFAQGVLGCARAAPYRDIRI